MNDPIPYPNITDSDPARQLREVRAYLYQLVDRLNFILEQLEGGMHLGRQ